jgi:hypothetical protein
MSALKLFPDRAVMRHDLGIFCSPFARINVHSVSRAGLRVLQNLNSADGYA